MNDRMNDGLLLPVNAPCASNETSPHLPEFERPGNPELLAAGWSRRFMADSARLEEYQELYRSMGYDVRAEKVPPEEIGPDCTDCRLVICRQFITLYTRKQSA